MFAMYNAVTLELIGAREALSTAGMEAGERALARICVCQNERLQAVPLTSSYLHKVSAL